MSALAFDEVAVGTVLPPLSVTLSRADLVRYAGASGDFNPIHWNQSVASAVGLPDVIAHGMLTMALAARMVTDWCGDPSAIRDYGVTFTRPVVVPNETGAVVEVSGTVKAVDGASRTATVAIVVAAAGQRVFVKSTAVVALR
jgi:acyl dehydratase